MRMLHHSDHDERVMRKFRGKRGLDFILLKINVHEMSCG